MRRRRDGGEDEEREGRRRRCGDRRMRMRDRKDDDEGGRSMYIPKHGLAGGYRAQPLPTYLPTERRRGRCGVSAVLGIYA